MKMFFHSATKKNTHICKVPFACQNMLKLTYSNLEFQNFPGRTHGPPSSRGGEGREGGRGRIGKGREGREGTGEGRREEWGEGRGGALDMGSAPPRDKLWIRPCSNRNCCHRLIFRLVSFLLCLLLWT